MYIKGYRSHSASNRAPNELLHMFDLPKNHRATYSSDGWNMDVTNKLNMT